GARNKALGVRDELVEVVVGPGAALGLQGGGEIEPASLALMVADDAVKIRTHAVGAALLEGMASGAFLGRSSALLDRCGLQKLLDRLRRRGRGFLAAWCFFLHGDLVTRLFRRLGREQRAGGEVRDQENKAGAENRTENFIEFEGVHFGSGSRPEDRL